MQRERKWESLKFALVLIAKCVGFLILEEHRGLERGAQCAASFKKKTKKGAIFLPGTEAVDQIHATVFVLMKLHEGRAGHGLERRGVGGEQWRTNWIKTKQTRGWPELPFGSTSGPMVPPLRL